MTSSSITGLNVKNTPVQGFSVNGAKDLTLDKITIDNTAGDVTNGGHNTDAFDVGSSTGVYITNANIKNKTTAWLSTPVLTSTSLVEPALAVTVSPSAPLVVAATT